VTNSVRPIHAHDDVKGLKLRTPPELQIQASMEALGAIVQAIAFPELYLSLSQKVVDGEENPIPVIYFNKFYEVQKHLAITRHIYNNMIHTVGANTWKKLTQGLPASAGRIGLDVYRKDPHVVFAVVESDEGGRLDEFESRSREGGVFRSDDSGEHWTRLSAYIPRPFYFGQIRVQPDDATRLYLLGVDLWLSDDGGKTFRGGGAKNVHPDCHAMWIDPNNGRRVLMGTDGGVYLSRDRAASWDFIDNIAIGEFYDIAADMAEPYHVYGGLQDNQSWGGPSQTRFDPESWLDDPKHDGISNADWVCLGGGEGFHVSLDPLDPNIVYADVEGGDLAAVNLATGRERLLKPSNKEGEPRYRFNWNTPFVISPHDPTVLWRGGNHLFRLDARGDRWTSVSPDLSTMDPKKMVTGGSAAETHCTIVSLSESPLAKGQVWAGTDDGKVWTTPDGGQRWDDVTANLRGVPAGLYVSSIETSHHDRATAYVTLDGHRSDRLSPYVLVTRDGGKSWATITGDLPAEGPVQVIREDPGNPDLLFAGTEFGIFASFDRGAHWRRLGEGLPTVAVDDILVHPREQIHRRDPRSQPLRALTTSPHSNNGCHGRARLGDVVHAAPGDRVSHRTRSGNWGQRDFTARNPTLAPTSTIT
jgi:photosystem II stability/assembly factor-like uncharacterized protein